MRKLVARNRITRSEAQAFRKRWKIANAAEREELCNIPEDEKLKQLATLMRIAKDLGWTKAPEVEVNEVRDRWNKLRKAYHA